MLYAKALEQLEPVGCNWWTGYPASMAADGFVMAMGFDYTNTNMYMIHNGEPVAVHTDAVRPCRMDDFPIVPGIWSKEYADMHRRLGLPYERKEYTDSEWEAERDIFADMLENTFALEESGKIVGMGRLFDDHTGIGPSR